MPPTYKEFKKAMWEVMRTRAIRQRTKIRLKTGEIVPATLWGVKGQDLFGGRVKYKGKVYYLGDPQRGLPRSAVPINPTEKTPFVDFPYRKRRKK